LPVQLADDQQNPVCGEITFTWKPPAPSPEPEPLSLDKHGLLARALSHRQESGKATAP
jgi:hypothetical protein